MKSLLIKTFPALVGVLCLLHAPAVLADSIDEGFDSDTWGEQRSFSNHSNGVWEVNGSALAGASWTPLFTANSGDQACWMHRWSGSTNAWAKVQLTSGAGTLSFWAKSAGGTQDLVLEKSSTGTGNWTSLTNWTLSVQSWVQLEYAVQEHGAFYLRIRKTGDSGSTTGYLGIDDVAIDDPPVRLELANLVNDPDPVYIGDSVHLQVEANPIGTVSNLAVTSFWQVAGGPWTATPMTNAGGNTYRTSSQIPAQDQVGVPVKYYARAWFEGYNAISPASTTTNSYSVLPRDFETSYDSISVTGDPATPMTLYDDYAWQGIYPSGGALVDAAFQFAGQHTNGATPSWGENRTAALPFEGTATQGGPSITIAGTNSNPLVFTFNETSLAYSVREGFFQNFTGWTTGGFGNATNDGWVALNALVGADAAREHVGNASYLNSNGIAAIRSPRLPDGVGRISFWYRNYSQSGSPVTHAAIQKSDTGGTNANEWVTIGTIDNIYGTEYGRFSMALNDRHLRYIRIRNSTNDSHAALCIDDLLIAFAGAGVVISNATVLPAEPTVFDPVTLSAEIAPRAGASALEATLYWRSGSAGEFNAIGMTNNGSGVYTITNVIPAAAGDGHGGAGTVEYYISCAFEGYESELASPDSYPAGGASSPASYTIAPARVVLSNVLQDPDPARVGSGVDIQTDAIPSGGAYGVSMATWYRRGTNGTFTKIDMNETATSNRFETASSIPGNAQPGETVQYYVQATFFGPSAQSPTTYPSGGAANPTSFVFRAALPVSTYTSLRVTGVFNTNLMLIRDHVWQGAATVPGFTDTAFYFEAQNGGTVNWGDSNPPYTTPSLFGNADSGAAQIAMQGTYAAGHFVFQFNETNQEYSAQQARYVNFDDWDDAAAGFDTYTNPDDWVIQGARTTTPSGEDLERTFTGTGRSCILSATNDGLQFVRSPGDIAGIGQVGFRYRNWADEDDFQPAGFTVQKSDTGLDWYTIDTVTNILSRDYVHYSLTLSEDDFYFIRIVNSTNNPRARLCLDEVFVAHPGPRITFSNVQNTPSNPDMIDDVIIEGDIIPVRSATSIEATVWLRAGTNGVFESLAMTNTAGNHFETVTTVPKGWAGTMQYYIEASFRGMYADERVTRYYPSLGPLNPESYENDIANNAETDFEGDWPSAPSPKTYTNANGWVISDGFLRGTSPLFAYDGARSAWLNRNSPTNAWLVSPYLSNGAGLIAYFAKSAGGLNTFAVQSSTDGTNWLTLAEYALHANDGWQEFTYFLNDRTPQYLRILKLADDGSTAGFLGFDNITISFPPAEIRIKNIEVTPIYPDDTGAPQIRCEVESVNPFLQAIGIVAEVYYRTEGETTFSGPAPMKRDDHTFTSTTGIPAFEPGTLVEYYIQATFKGYSESPRESRSPSFYPAGMGGVSTNQFFLAPTNRPAAYYVRPQFMAGYQNFDLWTNATGAGNHAFGDWSMKDARVTNLPQGVWHSTAWAAELLNTEGDFPDSYLQSPLLTNGVGTFAFFARNATNSSVQLRVRVSANGQPYTTVATVTNTSHTAWTRYSFELNTTVPTTIRLYKQNETYEGETVWIDDVEMAFIPSAVSIHDVVLHPGYPAAGTAVDVACKITALSNVVQEAANISVGLYYRNATEGGGFTGPVPMLLDGGTYSMLSPIPGSLNDSRDTIEYYIEVTFDGYAYETEKNSRSPSYYPEGPVGVAAEHYYAAPTDTPAAYTVRQFASDFDRVRMELNGTFTDMRQSGDNNWIGLLFVNDDVILTGQLELDGLGYYDGIQYFDTAFQWGDSSQARDRLPYVGSMNTGEDAIVVSNMTRGAYVVRFDNQTLSYRVERGAFQDFDTWTASPNFFERNYSQPQIAQTSPGFNAWSLSSDDEFPEDFQSWFLMDTYWSGLCASGSVGWVIYDAQVIEDIDDSSVVTSMVCRLNPAPQIGELRTLPATVGYGVGTVTIEYRCLDDTFAPALYSDADTWDGVMVEADLRAITLPTDVSGTTMGSNTWMSILARHQNDNNYYELRAEQVALNRKRLVLAKRVAGTEELLWEGNSSSGSITEQQKLKLLVTTYDTSKVYLEVFADDVRQTTTYDTSGAITASGDVGFRAQSINMDVDDVTTGEAAQQTFKGWPESGSVSSYSQDGWEVNHAYRIDGDDFVELEDSAAAGLTDHPNVMSPLLTHGLGAVYFRYRKLSGGSSSLAVQWSTNQVDWTSVDTFSESTANVWGTRDAGSINVLQSNIYVRIINATNAGNARVQLDDIRFQPSPTLAPNWDFTTDAAGWTDPEGTWSVTNRRFAGVGVSDPLEIKIQTRDSEDQFDPWMTHATFSDRSNVDYSTDAVDVHTADSRLVRVIHSGGNGSVVLKEVTMTAWRGDSRVWTNDWRISEGWIVSDPLKNGRALQLKLSRRRTGTEQYLLSPHMTNGLGTLSFNAVNGATGPVSFRVDIGPSTNAWEPVVEVTNNATSWGDPASYFGWTFNTNASLYLRVVNTSADAEAPLLIDNLTLTDFGEVDLYSWRAYNALITSTEEGRLRDTPWNVNGAYLNSNAVDQVHPAQAPLDSEMPFIQSGFLGAGIGEISFWYRSWDNKSKPTLRIKIAPTENTPSEEWKTVATIPEITTETFTQYTFTTYNATNHYVRFSCDTNANANGRICLEDILITAPFGSEVYLSNIRIDPEIPLDDTPVHVLADVTERFLNPSNITLTAYHRTGTNSWGRWTGLNARSMELVSSNSNVLTYRTIDPIPADKAIDTLVQYYVAANYDGLFSEATTPREIREFTNPEWYFPVNHNDGVTYTNPYYYVFSCLPGEVWVNEINVIDDDWILVPTQYVELAGVAGTDISQWNIEVLNTAFDLKGWYAITGGTALPNDHQGYGFWVLGETSMTDNADMHLTNEIPDLGAIRLYRSMGALEDGICFGDSTQARNMTNNPADGLRWVGYDDDWEASPLDIEGAGSNLTSFAQNSLWGFSNGFTPGGVNDAQTFFERNDPPIDVELMITGQWLTETQVWLVLNSNYTNDLNPTPWYSTNLMNTNGWIQATGVSHSYADGVYTQQFNLETNYPVYYYRVTGSY